jgi:methyltransferase
MVGPYLALLALVALERLFELWIAHRHSTWALARGGIEFGREHFPAMKLLHIAFFFSCVAEVLWLERPFLLWLALPMLFVFALAQVLRFWSIRSLGKRWNVRVIVIPGMAPVTSGPYRFLRHPNYLAVVLEMFAIPLIHTAYLTAVVFSLLNAWMLRVRIRCEDWAMAEHGGFGALSG